MDPIFNLLAERGAVFMDGLAGDTSPKFDAVLGFANDASLRAWQGRFAMDSQPSIITTPNSGIPSYLSMYTDPAIIEILFAPNKAAAIFDEVKKGDWVTDTATFPVVEHTGEVSSYGDYNENGMSKANTNFVQRQAYTYQTFSNWGEREAEKVGLAKINWAQEISTASITVLNKFQNLTYFYGVSGLQNYGLLNDPSLSASIQPGPKVYGAAAHGPWLTGGVVTATPNEIYADVSALVQLLITQSNGLLDQESKFTLAFPPGVATAFNATSQFNVSVADQIKKNYPNMRLESAVQYATTAGNVVQIIADSVEGQDTGYCAFTEKLRAHPIIVGASSFKQKKSQGTWGAIIRMPFAIGSMLGV